MKIAISAAGGIVLRITPGSWRARYSIARGAVAISLGVASSMALSLAAGSPAEAHERIVSAAASHYPPSPWASAYHPKGASAGVLALRGRPPGTGQGRAPDRLPARSGRTHSDRKPAQCTVPSAPAGVTATAGANQVTVSWSAANDNGTALDAYLIAEVTGPDTGASIATDGDELTASITGLAGGSAATFSVLAQSSCGNGPAATTSSVTPTGSASTYLGAVISAGPVAFYRLDEPDGTVMADSSGNNAAGTYSGQENLGQPPALASDPAPSAGYATCCSGIGSASPALPQYDDPRTVEAWFDTTQASPDQALVSWGEANTDEGFVVSVSSQSVNVDAIDDYLQFPTARPLDDGAWHLVDVTYDGTTVVVYLDGQEIGSSQFSGMLNTLDSDGMLLTAPIIGGYNYFNGELADVAIYPTALSSATVASHFALSGYGLPTAPVFPSPSYGGPNAADIAWGFSKASNTRVTGYLVTAIGAPNGAPQGAVKGDNTAARLGGLVAGHYRFTVQALDAYGAGPVSETSSFTVTGASTTYAGVVLSDAPVAFYRLSDSTYYDLADSSGSGATGSYNSSNASLGSPGPVTADPSTAVADLGNGSDIASAPASLPLYNAPRTVQAWVNTSSTSGNVQAVAQWGQSGPSNDFVLAEASDEVYVAGYNDDLSFPTPYAINDGFWHLITASYSGSSLTVYLDGQNLGTQSFADPLDTLPGSPLSIGADPGGAVEPLDSGAIADVAVFGSALSASQVTAEFSASGYARPQAPISPKVTAGSNSAVVTWTAAPVSSPVATAYLV